VSIRILLVDDHKIVRDGLRSLLELEPDMQVVGEAADGNAAIQQARAHTPDVVIMDIAMPGMNGIEATGHIVAELPATKVIGLSMHADRRFKAEMEKAGAAAYLRKDSAFEGLARTIRSVTGNGQAEPGPVQSPSEKTTG
jgi:two-component system, NarL family, response regulator NreC